MPLPELPFCGGGGRVGGPARKLPAPLAANAFGRAVGPKRGVSAAAAAGDATPDGAAAGGLVGGPNGEVGPTAEAAIGDAGAPPFICGGGLLDGGGARWGGGAVSGFVFVVLLKLLLLASCPPPPPPSIVLLSEALPLLAMLALRDALLPGRALGGGGGIL